MSWLGLIVGSVVTGMWVIGYLMAFFVDKSLQPFAESVTPVMLVFVGALFGTQGIAMIKKGGGGHGEG